MHHADINAASIRKTWWVQLVIAASFLFFIGSCGNSTDGESFNPISIDENNEACSNSDCIDPDCSSALMPVTDEKCIGGESLVNILWTVPNICPEPDKILILRRSSANPSTQTDLYPSHPLDPLSEEVYFGPPVTSYQDLNLNVNTWYHYGMWTARQIGTSASGVPKYEYSLQGSFCEAATDSAPNPIIDTPIHIEAGHGIHSCALFESGKVKCWGFNYFGQLGLGDLNNRGDAANQMGDTLPAINLGTGRTAKAIANGLYHTCVILDDDSVKCWGYNLYGQLGLGDDHHRGGQPGHMGDNLPTVSLGSGRTAKAIAAGQRHTCVILDDNSVKCWGYNLFGQLGLDDSNNRGVQANQMGDDLPRVNLGSGRTAKNITAGGDYTCALLDDDSVKCWGYNGVGQLGQGDFEYRGREPGGMGDNLPPINLGTGRTVQTIAAGSQHTCALLDDNSLKCWGYNHYGQLGLGDSNYRGTEINHMSDNLPSVNLGSGRTAKAIAAGQNHTCVILDDNSVKCWGSNYLWGQLGLGDLNNRGDAANQMGDTLPAINLGTGHSATSISVGHSHMCAILNDDTIKCWGKNQQGQLGLGDDHHRGGQPSHMGDNLPTVNLGS